MVAELGERPFLLPLRVRASTVHQQKKRTERVVLCLLVCPPANEISEQRKLNAVQKCFFLFRAHSYVADFFVSKNGTPCYVLMFSI